MVIVIATIMSRDDDDVDDDDDDVDDDDDDVDDDSHNDES